MDKNKVVLSVAKVAVGAFTIAELLVADGMDSSMTNQPVIPQKPLHIYHQPHTHQESHNYNGQNFSCYTQVGTSASLDTSL